MFRETFRFGCSGVLTARCFFPLAEPLGHCSEHVDITNNKVSDAPAFTSKKNLLRYLFDSPDKHIRLARASAGIRPSTRAQRASIASSRCFSPAGKLNQVTVLVQPKLKTKPHPSRHTCHLPCSADHNLSHATQTGMESRARSSRTVEREKADAKIFAGAYRNDLLTTFNGDSGDCNTRAPQHTSRQPRPQRSICAFWAFWIH